MIGVIDILRDDASVGARVGGTGTSARVYPNVRAQKGALPAVTVSLTQTEAHDTKDGVSTLDEEYVTVTSYSDDFTECRNLAQDCRSALDRASGTYNSQVIQSIQFLDKFTDYEQIENNIVHFIEQNYKVRVLR